MHVVLPLMQDWSASADAVDALLRSRATGVSVFAMRASAGGWTAPGLAARAADPTRIRIRPPHAGVP